MWGDPTRKGNNVYWSKMTLNYRVIVERYPFPNEVVGGSISDLISSVYLTGEKKLSR
jgi:hypothetical protein